MRIRPFILKLLALTAALAAITALAVYLVPSLQPDRSFTWFSLLFFAAIIALTYYVGLQGLKKKSGYGFVASINGTVMMKLFLSVAIIIGYLVIAKPNNALFIIPFFFFYIVFTVFEIRELLMAQKYFMQQQKKDEGTRV